jgi:hypothetical protein
MEDLLLKAWPVIEQSPLLAAIFLLIATVHFYREMKIAREDAKAARDARDVVQEKRIEEGKKIVSVLERNIASDEALAELIKDRDRRWR